MSKKIDIDSLPGVLAELETGTQAYRAAATELTNRIVKFEGWLNRLPGKVPAQAWESDDDEGEIYFIVSLQRDGKQWTLRHWMEHASSEVVGQIHDLRDASIETKIRAMRLFPRLLGAIRDSQLEFVKRSADAAAEFDKFAAVVGIEDTLAQAKPSKEGK